MTRAPKDASGPFDELFPGWNEKAQTSAGGPLHGRVLEVPRGEFRGDEGGVAFVLVLWKNPGTATQVHQLLRSAIEALLLGELSRSPAELFAAEARHVVALQLIVFEPIEGLKEALRAFGLHAMPEAALCSDDWKATLAQVRGEASREGLAVGDPASVWEAEFTRTSTSPALEHGLRACLGERVFGSEPGSFLAALNELRHRQNEHDGTDSQSIPASAEGLDALEKLVVSSSTGVIRWVPPLLFQTLCDAVATTAVKERKLDVQWAPSEADENGTFNAPMVRFRDGKGWAHVPLGRDLLRWCVMPAGPGETIPPLSVWLDDRFPMA